jgi:quercetin dioxygenase-like cupin family protein
MTVTPRPGTPGVHEPYICVVAGGNHVMIMVDAAETDGAFDVIQVTALPGGGPPPHCHEFEERFHVVEGTLTFTGDRDGEIVPIATAGPGQVVVVPPGTWHGTVNDTDQPVRFTVVGRPGVMSAYFREAGVRVPSMTAPPPTVPPGPGALKHIAQQHDILFWPG